METAIRRVVRHNFWSVSSLIRDYQDSIKTFFDFFCMDIVSGSSSGKLQDEITPAGTLFLDS
jgi:hypothetical protein